MAINHPMLKELCERLTPGARVASMGYPDILSPAPAVQKLLGSAFDRLEYRSDSARICDRHGLRQVQIPDSDSFFTLLGVELKVFDIVQDRGNEIICDLNYPVDESLLASFDFVIDVGTLEHCFNIAQAAINMAGLLREGGIILHENPFNWMNHGFYGLNPTWYADFYEQNGFKILSCIARTRNGENAEVKMYERFKLMDKEYNLFVVAQRIKMQQFFVYPLQTREAVLSRNVA